MKKGQFSKLIVLVVVVLNVLFTVATLIVFCKTGTEPTSLVIAWFTFTGTELMSLAVIKIKKKVGKEDIQDEDPD
jgi:hypothetical protein